MLHRIALLLIGVLCLSVTALAQKTSDSTVERLRHEAHRYSVMADSFHEAGNDSMAYELYKQGKAIAAELREKQHEYFVDESQRRLMEKYRYRTASALMTLLVITIIVGIYIIRRQRRSNRELVLAHLAEQEALRKAERAVQVQRDFLNNVSHEMRTPLNSIAGFSEVLASPGMALTAAEKLDLSQRIKESSQLLTDIVDKMIELSRVEGMTSLEKNDLVAPNILGTLLCQRLQDDANEGVSLRFSSTLKDDFTIVTNNMALEQVLHHLLDNALRFTTQGSVVLSIAQNGTNVVFCVTDTGPGIGEEYREHLFDLFVDTHGEVKTTGMGLSICHRLAQLLGGTIRHDTAYTGGTRFVLQVPRN